jgi:hypothetical protein
MTTHDRVGCGGVVLASRLVDGTAGRREAVLTRLDPVRE